MRKTATQHGQSLIEAVVVVAIFMVILVALVTALTASLSSTLYARDKSLANKYVIQGMEAVRNIRDRDWDIFSASDKIGHNNGLKIDPLTGDWIFDGLSDIPATGFTREVYLRDVSGGDNDEIEVTVKVSWQRGGQQQSSSSQATYTKWKNI